MNELYKPHFQKGMYIFRGQSNSNWELKSSFDRLFEDVQIANQILNEFKDDCEKFDFSQTSFLDDDMKVMALGQHFGLPTRLLDWSFSPYVAAFFALSDVNVKSYDCDHVAIWCLNSWDAMFKQELGLEIINIKQVGNQRLRNQDGLFTYLKSADKDLEKFINKLDIKREEPVLRKILIHKSELEIAINDLDAMGINNLRIYPDLTGAALNSKLKYYMKTEHNRVFGR
jgi:hypothetical protein